MNDYQPRNLRIYTYATQRAILHIEDALEIGKIRLDIYQFQRGAGASANIATYIDADDARYLAHVLITDPEIIGTGWTDYKGGANRATGEITSRITTLQWTRTDRGNTGLRVQLSQGPGKLSDNGAVMPAGKLASITTFVPAQTALTAALALRDHLHAWATATYYARKETTWAPKSSSSEQKSE